MNARDAALAEIEAADTLEAVTALDARLLGKKGALAQLKTRLGSLATVDEKRAAGQAVNEAMTAVSEKASTWVALSVAGRYCSRAGRRPSGSSS